MPRTYPIQGERPPANVAQERSFVLGLIDLTPTLRRYARSLVRSSDGADDLLQDTFERAWRARDRYDPELDLRRWLVVIMRNRFYDVVASNRNTKQDTEGYHAARLAAAASQAMHLEVKGLLVAIAALPALYRQAMNAVVLDGQSYRNAAAELGCPVATLKSRVQRSRHILQEHDPAYHGADKLH